MTALFSVDFQKFSALSDLAIMHFMQKCINVYYLAETHNSTCTVQVIPVVYAKKHSRADVLSVYKKVIYNGIVCVKLKENHNKRKDR